MTIIRFLQFCLFYSCIAQIVCTELECESPTSVFDFSFGTAQPQEDTHIVYLGNLDESLHPDAVTDSHYSILEHAFNGSSEAARAALVYSYRHGFSGFAARLSPDQVARISGHSNVVSIFPSKARKLHTTNSWGFMGVSGNQEKSLFDSDSAAIDEVLLKKANYGRDVIIGVFDTGIWPEASSFSDESMGPVPSRWKGTCESGQMFDSSNCNRKLIGARYFYSEMTDPESYVKQNKDILSPRDANGHGTHTASTAGGRFVKNANWFGFANGTAKGGAPMSRIAAYKICWEGTVSCRDSDILAAFDKAIHDGVDIISMSIGGGTSVNDPSTIGAFHAMQKGIVVITSAGNSLQEEEGGEGSVNHLAPWVITVGASTISRSFTADLSLGNKATFRGSSLSSKKLAKKQYPLISSANAGLPMANFTARRFCLRGSLDPKKVNGTIVACLSTTLPGKAGQSLLLNQEVEVFLAGGAGIVFCNETLLGDVLLHNLLPAVHVSEADGEAIFAYINSTRSPVAYLSPGITRMNQRVAPVMAFFSSTGPNSLFSDILKPDITAPGVSVLAAYTQYKDNRTKYLVDSGTSMSCPHVSGIAALLKSYRPDWSPAAIKSAILTTGFVSDNSGEPIKHWTSAPAIPFGYGGGHINPNSAAHPGLIYDATEQDYINFLCEFSGNQKLVEFFFTNKATNCSKVSSDLNQPSITISALNGSRVVSRRVTNVDDDTETTYKLSIEAPDGVSVSVVPKQLVFEKKGETKSFEVHFQVHDVTAAANEYVFGHLTWSNGKYSVRSPISVNAIQALDSEQ